MTFNGMPGLGVPSVVTPDVVKVPISCCSYVCLQGTPARWTCPGCGREHVPPGAP